MLLTQVLEGLPAQVLRDGSVTGFGPLSMNREGLLHYFADPRFTDQVQRLAGPGAVLTTEDLAGLVPQGFALALCADPRELFLAAYLRHGASLELSGPVPNVIASSASIHPLAFIAEHGVMIGERVSIGANAVIHERVSIEDDAVIGANSVIGGEGFEVGMLAGRQRLVPHYGSVLIRRGAVIQCNVSVDRGLYGGVTEIGEDSVIDNLVHVAHNVRIGRNCQVIAHAMIGGSTQIGDGARIGPNATVSNGLNIGNGARITLGAVVTRDVEDGGHVSGNFAIAHARFLDNLRALRR